jgi:hypothetical protein
MEINIDVLIKLVNFGLTNLEIANELETSRSTIVRLKSKYKLKSKINEKKKDEFCCLNCEKSFTSLKSDNRKFCSQSCSAIFNNKSKKKYNKNCENCNNELKNYVSESTRFCKRDCYLEHRKNERIKKIIIGDVIDLCASKKFLIEKNGEKCEICNWNEKNKKTNKVPIQLDHINGNAEDNRIENLRLLCPNCHSLTETYGALNIGFGRKNRRR